MKDNNKYYFYVLLLLGLVVRLRAYFFNRALWFDEALLANNIIDLSFVELTGVLPNNQAAPIGFLFVEKLLISVLGSSEYILRLAPLIVALLSIVLFYQLSQKLLSKKFALLALAFLLFSQPHIYYSTELKQYIFDVLGTILILRSTIQLLEQHSRNNFIRHAFLGAILVWFTQPVVFVLAASFLTIAYRFYQKELYTLWKYLVLMALFWGISFSIYFFCFLAPSIANNHLQDFHTAYFMPLDITAKASWEWYFQAWFGLFRNPVGVLFKFLAGSITILGVIWAFRTKKEWLILLMMPICLAFAASALQQYSTIPRLLLFALPLLLLLMLKSFECLYEVLKAKHQWGKYLASLLIGLVLLQPILDTIHEIARPEEVEEIKNVLRFIKEHQKAEDLLYLYPYAKPQFDYYKKEYGFTQMKIKEGSSPFENWKADISDLSKGKKRVWLLLSHYRKTPQGTDAALYTQHFDQYGKQIAKMEEKGSVCYLYEF